MSKPIDHPSPGIIPVNPALVWDYDIPDDKDQTDAFRRLYLARVLSRGSANDLRTIGFKTIYAYLPELNLPVAIREFWQWYFNLPDIKTHYEDTDRLSTPGNPGDQ